ncbi:MAG: type III secretion inner membrane ring lipoprotein SctJ [Pseudomonadota bacterium]
MRRLPQTLLRSARTRLAVLCRCMVLCGALALAACQSELYSNVTESEANEMLAILLQQGLDAKKASAGDARFTITVNDDETLRALQVLREAGLPRTTRSTMGQVFARSGIVSSPFEERIRFVYALGEEVSGTLEQIDGVLAARVHIVLPEEPELGQELRPSSAAVFLKQRSNTDLDYLIPQVRRLVSNAIEGVDYEQVSVTLVEARPVDVPAPTEAAYSEVLPGLEIPVSSLPQFYLFAGGLALLLALSLAGNAVLAVRAVRRRGRLAKVGE